MSAAPSKPESCRFTLRDLHERDRDAALDLWVAAWRKAMPEIDFDLRRKWFSGHLAQLKLRGFVMRCATGSRDRRVLGFIALSPKLRHLEQIVVKPDQWGNGVAASLMTEAKRLSPDGLWLDVNEDNSRAIAFYEKHGFRRLNRSRNPKSGLPTFRYAWGDVKRKREKAKGER
ncbi:MAG: GNAT family N-acetyltransferase [Hyphomicrobiales bacterium]|nr:GNAT family N-acetyltransferase [Hyphomicrobiales bacterium]